ncbi:hypothetical protein KAW50_05400 [candidate division WOR-3 bacterium]|nr:hypothetical protein [candidate division WOR-3 bacterium]
MKYKLLLGVLLFIGCNRKDFLNPNDPINSPSPPILIYPTGNMLVYDNPPRLYWVLLDTSFDVVYEVQGAENSNFNNPIFSMIISSDGDTVCYYMSEGLLKEHCFWRVRAKAEGASDNAWGEWASGSFWERFPLIAEYVDIPGGDEIIIRDDYAYIIDDRTFHILDVSDPAEPEFIESFTDSSVNRFHEIEKEGNYLYLSCRDIHYDYFLQIYSISNPSSPQFTGACSLRYSPNYLAISYPAVYVGQPSNVAIVDISDPANPFVANSIEVDYSIRGLAVKKNYLILFTSSKIKVYDITDPFHPSIANNYSYSYMDEFCISGDTLFVADDYYTYDVTIFDISALPAIKKTSSFSSDYSFSDMCFSDNCLVGRHSSYTICIFELSGARKPEEGRLYPSYPYTRCISANKGYLYLISRYGGIQVVKLHEGKY